MKVIVGKAEDGQRTVTILGSRGSHVPVVQIRGLREENLIEEISPAIRAAMGR